MCIERGGRGLPLQGAGVEDAMPKPMQRPPTTHARTHPCAMIPMQVAAAIEAVFGPAGIDGESRLFPAEHSASASSAHGAGAGAGGLWESGSLGGRGAFGRAPSRSTGEVAAVILIKLLIDLYLRAGPRAAFPLALMLLQVCARRGGGEGGKWAGGGFGGGAGGGRAYAWMALASCPANLIVSISWTDSFPLLSPALPALVAPRCCLASEAASSQPRPAGEGPGV